MSTITSCQDFGDEFLTQVDPSQQNSGLYWKNLDDCQSGLAATYNAFKASNIYLTIEETQRTDLAWPGTNNKFPSATNEYYLQTFNSSSAAIGNKWNALYKGVFFANQVIEGLKKVEAAEGSSLDVERWTLINAQARFLRGLFYHYLSTSFNGGAVPIFDFVPAGLEEFYRPCNTREDVIAFYRADMEYAEANLPKKGATNDWKAVNGDLGRPRSEAASAILGISYLYEAGYIGNGDEKGSNADDYSQARKYFEKIINAGTYSLAGPGDNSGTTNELNSESILEVIYTYDFNSEYNAGSISSLTTLINRNISQVGGWSNAIPAFWMTHNFSSEPVDRLNPENKVNLKRDLHGDVYYGYDPDGIQKIVSLGGLNHVIYPVMARPKDILDHINGQYSKKDILSSTEAGTVGNIADSDMSKISMTWPDSVYIFLKKLELDDAGNIKAKTRDEMTGANEGYEFVNSNKDMMPTRPQVNDRSMGAIPVYDATKTSAASTSLKEQLYDYASAVGEGTPYRYRNRSLRAKYGMWTYYDMDNGHYQYTLPADHFKCGAYSFFKKYTNWETRSSEDAVGFSKADSEINLRLIRLADIYLMYAECLIKGGADDSELGEALKYVNKVRKRAGTVLVGRESTAGAEYAGTATYQDTNRPEYNIFNGDNWDLYNDNDITADHFADHTPTEGDIIDTAKELMNHLMYYERPLELCLDGHAIRSSDLRRWGITKSRFQYLGSDYPFTQTGIHILNWAKCYNTKTKVIDFNTQCKNWAFRFKYIPENKEFNSVFCWLKNSELANTKENFEFQQPASNYTDEKAYFPIPNNEIVSNPEISKIVDREDLEL